MKLNLKRRLTSRSTRVKSVDLHPTEPWMVTSLYNGNVYIWNLETKKVIKTLEVSNLPVRIVKFISRKNWIVTGSDERLIKVYNYNTLEHVVQFGAHLDYIRTIAIHPAHPFILSSGDDGVIRLWNWDKKWAKHREYCGHSSVVMHVVFNPKDTNQFASASLDKTVKFWQLDLQSPNFSLKHERDVNCVEFHPGNDKPYIVTGEDGGAVRVWDYQTKCCIQILHGHSKDVNTVMFHPSLPLIFSGGSDNLLSIWHSGTYRLEKVMNYGLERVWMVMCQRSTNTIAVAFDEGCMALKIGSEKPPISMDLSGKILWAKHFEIQQANIKTVNDQDIKEGERLPLAVKDMGTCEIFPLSISHSPNGRFAVVCGEGEYIIYTALTLRSKAYGQAQEFVWSNDTSMYATQNRNTITIFKNFKESKQLKPSLGVLGIYGGHLLGVKSNNCLTFYDWESATLIRRIEVEPKHVFWNETNALVCLSEAQKFHILQYNSEALELSKTLTEKISEDGIEDTFEVLNEKSETVFTGIWIGDCFLYTNSINRLSYFVGGEVTTIAHLDSSMYLLGYISKENRVYLSDKELGIVSYRLWLSVLEYQTAVVRKDFNTADKILPSIPPEQRNNIALFLECQMYAGLQAQFLLTENLLFRDLVDASFSHHANGGFKQQALAVSNDIDHKFELSLQLKDLKIAHKLAQQCDSVEKWKELADLALKQSDFLLAQECLDKAQDWEALVLLASSTGNRELMLNVAHLARQAEKTNVEFLASLLLGRLEDCLELLIKSGRLPEAAFFAYSYLPSEISRVVQLWRAAACKLNKRKGDAIADPDSCENLFPNYKFLIKAQEFLKVERSKVLPASTYLDIPNNFNYDQIKQMLEADNNGQLASSQSLVSVADDTDEEVEGFVKIQAWNLGQETPPFVEIESSKETLTASSQKISIENHSEVGESEQDKSISEKQTVNESETEESRLVFDELSMALLQQELDLDLDNLNIDDFNVTEFDSVELLDDLNDAADQ